MEDILLDALKNGFITSSIKENNLIPKILTNSINTNEKVLTSIISEFRKCDSYLISSAFLTDGGVHILRKTLDYLESKNIKGTIIVSQYQNFTTPKALKMLKEYKCVNLRIVPETEGKMHTKGYIFRQGDLYTIIIGSSNLTESALCSNLEWNVKLNSTEDGSYYQSVIKAFNNILSHSISVDDNFIKNYEDIYSKVDLSRKEAKRLEIESIGLTPNKMQEEALKKIKAIRDMGADKALIISATGTGKTILSAFDVKKYKPKKFLFIVHREKIAKDALKSYKRVIGEDIDTSLMSSGNIESSKYNFAMIQTLISNDNYKKFKPDEFDYIIFDEIHHGGAETYQKIFEYFKPKFLLGMTATPDRTDGFDIYKMFNHQIAYEIRLQDAMREEMVCPFHYYGIADIEINGNPIDDNYNFENLTCDKRIDYIIEKSKQYGYSGSRLKGLIFVRTIDEANAISDKLNKKGFRTKALSGQSPSFIREDAINRLEQDENLDNSLDFIITVDIFNEGVDIPSVNQIIMLRPTESNIIFVQQLGRGLRKKEDKDYLVVIDFIGNYNKNFLIPMALGGKKARTKENSREIVSKGDTELFGSSTVYFDEISRDRVLAAIDKANYSDSKMLRDAYKSLKNKLGRIPTIKEFDTMTDIDIMRVITANDNYYSFVNKMEKDKKEINNVIYNFSELEFKFLSFISKKYLCGKRPHELEFIKTIIYEEENVISKFEKIFTQKYPNLKFNKNTKRNLINQMNQTYFVGSDAVSWKDVVMLKENSISPVLKKLLENKLFRECMLDVIKLGIERFNIYYKNTFNGLALNLYERYSYEDAIRLLDWDKDQVKINIGGYKYDKETNTYPIFINYNKDSNIAETIKYDDKFKSEYKFSWMSKNKRNINSNDIKILKDSAKNSTLIYLFVRKHKKDSNGEEFYFLGSMKPDLNSFKEVSIAKTTAVNVEYNMDIPVRADIYDYITKGMFEGDKI